MISIVIPRELQPRGASLSEKKSRKVLITRPQPAAGEFAHRLEKDGFTCFVAPMTAYVEQDPGIADLSDYQAVIFTSAQTVQLFSKFFKDRYIPVFAVGDATAKAASPSSSCGTRRGTISTAALPAAAGLWTAWSSCSAARSTTTTPR